MPDQTLKALYGACELFVFPSRYEGFGLPLLEAMACGAPVASSRSGALKEVGHGAACFFDANDIEELTTTLSGLLDSPERRERLRSQGLKHSQNFRWKRTARETGCVLDNVTKGAA